VYPVFLPDGGWQICYIGTVGGRYGSTYIVPISGLISVEFIMCFGAPYGMVAPSPDVTFALYLPDCADSWEVRST
jgi:hypothetical protein